jgi:hypothetical protein
MSALLVPWLLAAATAAARPTPADSGYTVEPASAPVEALLAGEGSAWSPAPSITWGPPGAETTFRALWNGRGLFVRFDAVDPHPWFTHTHRDDSLYNEEVVEVFLDLDRSGTHYAEIELSPANVVCDFHVLQPLPEKDGDPPWKGDRGWDLDGIESRVQTIRRGDEATGWSATAFLPWEGFRSLPSAARVSLPPHAGDRWRFNVFRIERPHGPEDPERDLILAAWSPANIPKFHVASVFRDLHFH